MKFQFRLVYKYIFAQLNRRLLQIIMLVLNIIFSFIDSFHILLCRQPQQFLLYCICNFGKYKHHIHLRALFCYNDNHNYNFYSYSSTHLFFDYFSAALCERLYQNIKARIATITTAPIMTAFLFCLAVCNQSPGVFPYIIILCYPNLCRTHSLFYLELQV